MSAMPTFVMLACEVATALCLLSAVAIFYKICRDNDSIEGAASIRDWNTDKPFYPVTVFNSHRTFFPESHLTWLYWFVAVIGAGIASLLQLHHQLALWLNVISMLAGCGIVAVRFLPPRHKSAFITAQRLG